ncbi:MAG: proprotein convertase P-domain-containing protein, partial [Deltaproteobacteria bacterium]|nr:proprotein convertase P-domain-containing protein [Deltaproteobacteria bacterium]
TNGAGFHINHKFGFGRVNALAAVSAAHGKLDSEQYASPPVGPVEATGIPALPIPDNDSTGVSDTITVSDNVLVEFIEIFFTSDHRRWGDLEITLTSPEGTESVL